MRRVIVLAALLSLLKVTGLMALGQEYHARENAAMALNTVKVAPVEQALTFARIPAGGDFQLILVRSYRDGEVRGVDLSTVLGKHQSDPITSYQQYGYDALAALAAEETRITAAATVLGPAVELGNAHVAVGTNFPEHADEATVEDGPFLFTKAVAPTGPRSTVSVQGGLLDYEVELCFVGLEPIDPLHPPQTIGLFLCNDYTDRAKLLHHINVSDVASGKGFTTGKSLPGYLPIGDLFVIPRDRKSYVPGIELKLYLNGVQRQHALQRQAIWDFEELLRQTYERRNVTWQYNGGAVGLPLEANLIPARTAILGGTPAGTVFQGISLQHKLSGVLRWLLGGWNQSIPYWAIESYIAEARENRIYLQPGDTVSIHVDGLGTLVNSVVE